jgi:hypothetical protein
LGLVNLMKSGSKVLKETIRVLIYIYTIMICII